MPWALYRAIVSAVSAIDTHALPLSDDNFSLESSSNRSVPVTMIHSNMQCHDRADSDRQPVQNCICGRLRRSSAHSLCRVIILEHFFFLCIGLPQEVTQLVLVIRQHPIQTKRVERAFLWYTAWSVVRARSFLLLSCCNFSRLNDIGLFGKRRTVCFEFSFPSFSKTACSST